MAWLDNRFKKRIRFDIDNTGGSQTECPVLVVVDTQFLIDSEGMFEDGRDIRFAGADEITLLPFCVLSGINTSGTEIGVRVDSIPSGTTSIYMYFDYVCESIPNLSDSSYWYSSLDTEGSPDLTKNPSTTQVHLETGGSGGDGTAVERFSPTFNALNISSFDFYISAGDTFNVNGYAEHWINITGEDEIFYREWASHESIGYPFWDPWNTTSTYDATGLIGVHELNMLLHVHYVYSGTSHKVTDIVTVVLLNDPTMSVMYVELEHCPDPPSTETYYVKIGGDDGLDGKSYANAWATLNHAFQNTPADHGNIIRIDEGTYNGFYSSFPPYRCVNLVGGYWDGSWHDWTEGCGHDRPVIISQNGPLSNDDVSLKCLEIDATKNLVFPFNSYTYRLINCKYRGMMFAGNSTVTLVNTDHIFHQPTTTVLPNTVTPEHHEFVVHDPDYFNEFSPRNAKITPDADIAMIIDTWSTTGDQNKIWKVEANGSRTITFQLGDMLPDTKYDLLVDGVKVSSAVSNGSGVVTFPPYSGTFSEKLFETEKSTEAFVPRVMIF